MDLNPSASLTEARGSGILYIYGILTMCFWDGVHTKMGFCTYKVGFCTASSGIMYSYLALINLLSSSYPYVNK